MKNKINLIYGGGSVGLMGTVAKTVADGGCDVTGFLPEFFITRSKSSKNNSFSQFSLELKKVDVLTKNFRIWYLYSIMYVYRLKCKTRSFLVDIFSI